MSADIEGPVKTMSVLAGESTLRKNIMIVRLVMAITSLVQ